MESQEQPQHSQACREINDPDFYIYADGSGLHTDRLGGYSSVLVSIKYPMACNINSVGGGTHMETGRAEFLAILSGFHSIFESYPEWTKSSHLNMLRKNKPTVLVRSDREDLVGCINLVNERRKNLDLWARYDWYAQHFDIVAEHVKSKQNNTHNICDVQASQMRIVIRDYINVQKELNRL